MGWDRRSPAWFLEGCWWVVIGLHLWAIWSVPVFLTQDGPSHLYSASVFLQLLAGNAPVLGQIYEINARLVPNWLGSGLLLGLTSLFGFDGGEKTFVSLYVIGFALGFRAALSSMNLKDPWGKFLVLPLLFNHYLFFGLYNYLFGIVGSLFLFAYGLKHLGSLDSRRALILGIGFLIVYFTHLLPAALCGAALLVLLLLRLAGSRERPSIWARQSALLVAAGAPAALLCLRFLLSGSRAQGVVWGRPFLSVLKETVTAGFLVPFQNTPLVWTTLCLVTAVVVSGRILIMKAREGRWGFGDWFLLLGAGVFALQLICPEGLQGGSLISYRLGIFLWLALLGWVLLQETVLQGVPFSGLLGAVFLVGGISQPIYCAHHLGEFQAAVDDLARITGEIPAHSEVWPIVLDPFGRGADARGFSARNTLFSHAGLRGLASREDVASRIAFQGEFPLFPVRFRDRATTGYFKDGYDNHPEDFPIADQVASSWTGNHPAFLLLIGGAPSDLPVDSPLGAFLTEQGAPMASIDGDLGRILLFRLARREAFPEAG